jgi:putative inorganic carbon (hco3(-)) transporter
MLKIDTAIITKSSVILAFLALITFLPSVDFMPNYIYFHDSQRLLELLLLSLVLLHTILNKTKIIELKQINKHLRITLFLFLGLTCTSILFAKSSRHAIIEVSIFSSLLYLSIFVANLYQEDKEAFIRRLIYCIWAGTLLYIISFYVGYITAITFKTPLHWPYPFAGFNNIRSFNQYQLWPLAFITLPLLTFNLKKNTQVYLYFALTCWWVLLFYSASRGVLVAWLVGVISIAGIYRKFAWPMLKIQFINIATGFSGYYFLFKYIPSLSGTSVITSTIERETTSDRTALWLECLKFIEEYPLFGVGPMNSPWHNSIMLQPHNSILQLASEWGLPATSIILSLAGYGIYCWLKKFNTHTLQNQSSLDKNFTVILFFTLVTNAAYSLVDGVIVMPLSQVFMFTMSGLMVGHYFYDSSVTKNPAHQNKNISFSQVFASITLIALVWSTLPEIIQGLNGYERGFSMGPNTINPRIWLQIR